MIVNIFGLKLNLELILMGLIDSISLHKTLPVLSTSKRTLFLTLKILGVNGFMIIGSYYFYHHTLLPLLNTNDSFNLSWIFYRSFWLLPICGLCYAISLVWYQELADVIIDEFFPENEKEKKDEKKKKSEKKKNSAFEHFLYDLISWLFFYIQVQFYLKFFPLFFNFLDNILKNLIEEKPFDITFYGYLSSNSVSSFSDSSIASSSLFINNSMSIPLLVINLFSIISLYLFNIFLPFFSFSFPFVVSPTNSTSNNLITSSFLSSLGLISMSSSSSTSIESVKEYSLLLLNHLSSNRNLIYFLILRSILFIIIAIIRNFLIFYSNFLLSLLYSWYCYDLKWNKKKFNTKKKFLLIELNYNYFYGYGLPYVFLMNYFNFFISFGCYLMFFPFSIILGTINKYQKKKDDMIKNKEEEIENEGEDKSEEEKNKKHDIKIIKKTKEEYRNEIEKKINDEIMNDIKNVSNTKEKKIESETKVNEKKKDHKSKDINIEKNFSDKINVFDFSQNLTLNFIKFLMGNNKIKKD